MAVARTSRMGEKYGFGDELDQRSGQRAAALTESL